MLIATRDGDGQRVIASNEHRSAGPWGCPACKAEVILKKGQIFVHHFAHKSAGDCPYSGGESELHRRCKTRICDAMQTIPGCSGWELERSLGTVRPDASGYVNGQMVAVEVQASSLGLERIHERTVEYGRLGIPVLWVSLRGEELSQTHYKFSPKAWEKWLHELYLGRIYYWEDYPDPLDITPVRYRRYRLHVPYYDPYQYGGSGNGGGGYDKTSKRWVRAVPEKTVKLHEMQSRHRPSFPHRTVGDIPVCSLWACKTGRVAPTILDQVDGRDIGLGELVYQLRCEEKIRKEWVYRLAREYADIPKAEVPLSEKRFNEVWAHHNSY